MLWVMTDIQQTSAADGIDVSTWYHLESMCSVRDKACLQLLIWDVDASLMTGMSLFLKHGSS